MDSFDSLYRHLDGERLLERHSPELIVEARHILDDDEAARVAGVIATTDSAGVEAMRAVFASISGRAVPEDILLVGIVPREKVEPILSAQVTESLWKEGPQQAQRVLPIVASNRDGHRIALIPLDEPESWTI